MKKPDPDNKFCQKCKKNKCLYYCHCLRTNKAFCAHDFDSDTKFESEE